MITRGWGWGNEIQIQNSQNVEVYGNRVEMTGGGNGIVMIQQNRGSGTFGTYTTTGNQIHDNIIVDHDGAGLHRRRGRLQPIRHAQWGKHLE